MEIKPCGAQSIICFPPAAAEELRVIMGESVGITGVQYQILMVIARLQHGTGVAIKDVAIELRVVPLM